MLTEFKYQGSTAEKSSAQKLKQGASREYAEYHSRGSFSGTLLDKQKSTEKQLLLEKEGVAELIKKYVVNYDKI